MFVEMAEGEILLVEGEHSVVDVVDREPLLVEDLDRCAMICESMDERLELVKVKEIAKVDILPVEY